MKKPQFFSNADQLARRYEFMRPHLERLTGDDAALRAFDKKYRELSEQLSRRGDLEIQGVIKAVGYENARAELEQEFDDCLPVGTPSVKWRGTGPTRGVKC